MKLLMVGVRNQLLGIMHEPPDYKINARLNERGIPSKGEASSPFAEEKSGD
jgi:hypothetical protein